MPEIVILYTTWPDAETAEQLAAEAVAERLAACANILQPMEAIYRWQGAVERAGEIPMLLKTTRAAVPALTRLIEQRHPYDTPCILAFAPDAALCAPAFLAWVEHEVAAPEAEATG